MLALIRAEDRKGNVVGIKEIEFDNKKQRMMQAKAFGRNAVDRGQWKTCKSRRRTEAQVYDAIQNAIRLQVLPLQPIRATPLFSEHRPALQGNAPVLAGVEHQAGVAKLQADWQAGAQDEQNENQVG